MIAKPYEENALGEKFKLIADTIRAYPLQLKQAWEEASHIYIPENYKNVDNVVLSGMGGSALGARIVDSLAFGRLRIPFEVFTEFHVPNYVATKTLFIASSYSGNTEETKAALFEAMNKNAKIFGLTTGGKLAEILNKNKLPSYIFNPIHNPSKQPRMSLGYSTGAVLSLFKKTGLLTLGEQEIESAVDVMNNFLGEYHENTPSANAASDFAIKIKNRVPIFIVSEHLVGVVHAVKNQLNENSKTFSLLFDIPELNHHLLEGLKHPARAREIFKFIFVLSDSYSPKVKKRYPLTREVVEKNGYECLDYSLKSDSRISQVYEMLIFGSFVSYYLAKDYGIDPTEIPWVDYFKEKLAK